MNKNIEVLNDTDYANKELEEMKWTLVQTITADTSALIITTYENEDGTIAKSVYSYGDNIDAIEYYEIA